MFTVEGTAPVDPVLFRHDIDNRVPSSSNHAWTIIAEQEKIAKVQGINHVGTFSSKNHNNFPSAQAK